MFNEIDSDTLKRRDRKWYFSVIISVFSGYTLTLLKVLYNLVHLKNRVNRAGAIEKLSTIFVFFELINIELRENRK
jgi:hypothetical protein